jgi:hypothetical protein
MIYVLIYHVVINYNQYTYTQCSYNQLFRANQNTSGQRNTTKELHRQSSIQNSKHLPAYRFLVIYTQRPSEAEELRF